MNPLSALIALLAVICLVPSFSQGQGSGFAIQTDANDWVDCGPGLSTLDFPFTFEAWVFLGSGLDYEPILDTEFGSATYYGTWWSVPLDRRVSFSYGDGTGSGGANRRTFRSTETVPLLRWVHLAVVATDSVTVQHYIDGIPTGMTTDGSGQQQIVHNPGASRLSIGNTLANTASQWFENGQVDELRIWRTARTQTQIRDFMCLRVDPTNPDLEAYYQMDEGAGAGPIDLSGNGHDGSLQGASSYTLSGAAIGDTSVYAYPSSWIGLTLLMPGLAEDNMELATVPGLMRGVHLYRVNDQPNDLSGLPFTPNYYYGFYGTDQFTGIDLEFFLTSIICDSCSMELFTREDNSSGGFIPISFSSSTGNGCLARMNAQPYRSEYVLDFEIDTCVDTIPTPIPELPDVKFLPPPPEPCSFAIPNAFTPNQDGLNDLFRFKSFGFCEIEPFQMHIFNRWGDLVWRSDDFFDSWDGTFQGKDQEMGTYIWIAEYELDGEQIARQGTLTLMR